MKTLNQLKRYAALRVSILMTGSLAATLGAPAWAAQNTAAAADPESAARAAWHQIMKQAPAAEQGCFHAGYPSVAWERVDCATGLARVPRHIKPAAGEAEVVGNGNDYVGVAAGLISSAAGDFIVSGVKSEKSVGVAAFGGGGILGSNEYSVQINTNDNKETSACAGHIGCTVWQQFVYATDYYGAGTAALFMQYWLLDWGSSACPGGFGKYGSDCYANSPLAAAPDIPITSLNQLELAASVKLGGLDSVTLYYGSDVVTMNWYDSVLDMASAWNKVEFNIVGDAGGSQAQFNSGTTLKAILAFADGSSTKPTCLANGGTTGETNNLKLGSCTASLSYGLPLIEFTESN